MVDQEVLLFFESESQKCNEILDQNRKIVTISLHNYFYNTSNLKKKLFKSES